MVDSIEIGKRIQKIRKQKGLSQEKLADKLNIGDRVKISRIETGKQSMSANELIRFCEFFKISLDSLINDDILSSEDFLSISRRYISNETINIEERRDVIKSIYIELAKKELSNIDMYNKMNKISDNYPNSSKSAIEKYNIDDILGLKR